PAQISDWNQHVFQFPEYSIFHSQQWADVLRHTYRYEPQYLADLEGSNQNLIIPLCNVKSILTGKRGVSLPFSDFCPSLESGNKDIDVLQELKDFGKESNWDYFELRGNARFTDHIQPSMSYVGHMLDLTRSIDLTYQNFRPTTRRNIDKARRKKIEVHFVDDTNSVKEFYRLNCLTRRRHGLPPQPAKFFENIYQHLIKSGLGYVVLASYQKQTVAGLLVLTFGKRAIYKFGASESQYRNTNANYTLIWEVIKKCAEDKIESLHFGRTHPAATGLIQFKKSWGCIQHPIHYFRYSFKKKDFIKTRSQESGIYNHVFRILNIKMLKLIGQALYRHLG
ncbi:MAG: peptidoglycan bridge formation glycyltransferase FemA/FemB family protein, partial [bacterium]